jgi:dTDP-glucose 4,6-dehydratase
LSHHELTRSDCIRVLQDNRVNELEAFRRTEITILGGTGFLGSWISELVATLNDEFQFEVKLNLISRNPKKFNEELPHLASRNDIELLAADVRKLTECPMNSDWLIHAAANPDTRVHASNPYETASSIVEGTMNVIKAAERMGKLRKLLFISSGLVAYDLNSALPIKESVKVAIDNSASFVYQNSKRFAETLCSIARVQSRIPVVITRPFSFIGPYQSLDTPWAQTTFISDALHGRAIRILGDGKITRSFLYGCDAAFWILKILASGPNGDVVNLGSSEQVELEELAKIIAQNFSPKPDILLNTAPHKPGRHSNFLPDLSHAYQNYGMTNITSIEEAVSYTTAWYQEKQNAREASEKKGK